MARNVPVETGYEGRMVPSSIVTQYRQLINRATDVGQRAVAAQLAVARPNDIATLKAAVGNVLHGADIEVSEIDRQYFVAARYSVTGQNWNTDQVVDGGWEDGMDAALEAILRDHGEYDETTGEYEIVDRERFESDLAQFVGRIINDRSKHYVERYGERDYMRPRFARVPSGLETCAYCYALAGLGFQYKSAATARQHGHSGCDCAIVPSWGGSGAEGYDNVEYARMFRDARSWLNSSDAPADLRRRVSERDQDIPWYHRDWQGTLAAMRKKYDLK